MKSSHLDLARVFARLAELQINEVLVEAGPRLSGALLAAGLVDEWLVYVAPKLLGRDAQPLAALPRLKRLKDAPGFELRESVALGNDVRLRLRVTKRPTTVELSYRPSAGSTRKPSLTKHLSPRSQGRFK